MIELGTLDIHDDDTSAVEARNKVADLARHMQFGAIWACRLGTITSEISRRLRDSGKHFPLSVGIVEKEGKFGLAIHFRSPGGKLNATQITSFFDEVTASSEDGTSERVEAVKFTPVANFHPTDEFVEQQRENLRRLSRAALMKDLERKNQELEQTTRLKSEFLANMSHELRTPMNSIIGFTGRVIKKSGELLPERQLKNLHTVERNAHHLLYLINSLLDLSKIEAGKMDVFVEEFPLGPLVNEVVELTHSLVADKSLEMMTDLPAEDIVMHSDKVKLKQVLINLVSNAVKFTDQGSVTISARLLDSDAKANDPFCRPDAQYLSLTVTDTGMGMDAEAMEFVFEAFRQADGSATRKAGGTGLGLAITKSVTELLKGKIDVESQQDVGTTFTITIPVAMEDVDDVYQKETPLTAEGEPTEAGPTVLSIDDDPEVIELLQQYLTDEGFQTIAALSADEGIRLAKERQPFAITLDLHMPYKDGWSTLAELKGDETTRDIPVVIVTVMENKALGFKMGAADYLQKPVSSEDLICAFDRILTRRAQSVLVVDDSPTARELLRQVLEDEQIAVREARDGLDALEALEQSIPDVILLDLMMPVMDGFETLRRLKEQEQWAAIPVIVVTAKTLDEAEKAVLDEHVDTIIQKAGMTTESLLSEIGTTMRRLVSSKQTELVSSETQ